MARARIAMTAAQSSHGSHPHVVIIGGGQSVVIDLIGPRAEFGDIAARWDQIPRPHRRPILVKSGQQLATVRLEGIIGVEDNVDVGPRLAALTFIARNSDSVIVGHTTPTGAPTSQKWTLTHVTWNVLQRRHGDNAITRVRVQLELTESSNPFALTVSDPPAASVPILRPTTRRHTVASGESIWSIANKHYGSIEAWKRIADANRLVRLTPLVPGSILTLP